jgi:hypothetical protein
MAKEHRGASRVSVGDLDMQGFLPLNTGDDQELESRRRHADHAVIEAGELRTQEALVAALRARPRTKDRTVLLGLGGLGFISI